MKRRKRRDDSRATTAPERAEAATRTRRGRGRRRRGEPAAEAWYHQVQPIGDGPISDPYVGQIEADGDDPAGHEQPSVSVTLHRDQPPPEQTPAEADGLGAEVSDSGAIPPAAPPPMAQSDPFMGGEPDPLPATADAALTQPGPEPEPEPQSASDGFAAESEAPEPQEAGAASAPEADAAPGAEAMAEGGAVAPQRPFLHDAAPPAADAPMIIPVRAYYMSRPDDTLRSVAAQFLNTPSRWQELRSLNSAHAAVAAAEADTLLPVGTSLALPGDPIAWGRPDPVYLWTLAETFLYTAWGREPAPEEVVPFWRGLTSGAKHLDTGPSAVPPVGALAEPPIPPAEQPPATPGEIPVAPAVPVPEPAPGAPPGPPADPTPPAEHSAAAAPPAEHSAADPTSPVEQDPAHVSGPEPSPLGDAASTLSDPPSPAQSAAAQQPPGQPAWGSPDPVVAEPPAADAAPLPTPPAEQPPAAAANDQAANDPAARPPAVEPEPPMPSAGMEAEPPPSYWLPAEPSAPVGPEAHEPSPPQQDAPPQYEPPPAEAPPRYEPPAEPAPTGEPVPEEPAPAYETPPQYEPPAAPPPAYEPAAATPPSQEVQEPPPAHVPPPLPEPPNYLPPTTAGFEPTVPMPDLGPIEPVTPPRPEMGDVSLPDFMPSLTGSSVTADELPVEQVVASTHRVLAGTTIGDAMMLWQIGRLRRRRGAGRTEAAPDPLQLSLEQTARMDSLRLIEAAMRQLRAVTVAQMRPKPRVVCVRTGLYGFEVLLDEPVEAPEGWQSAAGGYVLELPHGVTVEQLDAAGHGVSLCPTLVPVGETSEGPLLLNVEEIGCLAVYGAVDATVSLLTSIVETLGSSPLAGDVRIITVGVTSPLGPGWERIHALGYDSPQLEHLLSGAMSSAHGTGSVDVLVVGPGNDLLFQRAAQIATTPGARLALVGASSSASARWPWRIHTDEHSRAVVHPIAVSIKAAQAMSPELAYLLTEGTESPQTGLSS